MPSDAPGSGPSGARATPGRRRSLARRAARGLAWLLAGHVALIILLVIGAVIALQTNWGRERVRLLALERLRAMVEGRVEVARLGGDFLHGITLDGVSITGPTGEPLLSLKRLEVDYQLAGFLRREILFGDILLVEPRIELIQDAAGKWNYERILPFLVRPEAPEPKAPGGWGSVVRIGELRIVNGTARLSTQQPPRSFGPLGPTAVIRELNGKLELELHRRDDEDRKRFAAEDLSFLLDEPRLAVRELDARATVTSEGVDLERLLVRTASTELSGEGKIRNPAAPVFDLVFRADPLALDEVRGFVTRAPAGGTVRGTVRIAGPSHGLDLALQDFVFETPRSRVRGQGTLTMRDAPVIEGEFILAPLDPSDARAALAAYPLEEPVHGRLSARGSRERMEIAGDVAFGGTTGKLAGTLGHSAGRAAYDLRLAVTGLDMEDFLHEPAWRSAINAELHVAGTGLGTAGDVTVEASLRDSRIRGYNLRSAALNGRLREGIFRVQAFRLALPRSSVSGSGTVPVKGPLDLRVSVASRDLGDFYPAGGRMPAARFEAQGVITGPLTSLDAKLSLSADSLAAKGYVIDALETRALLADVGRPGSRLLAEGRVGRVLSQAAPVVEAAEFSAGMAGDTAGVSLSVTIDSLRTADAHVGVWLGGRAPRIVLDRASFTRGSDEWVLEPPGRLAYQNGRVQFEEFALVHNGQRVGLTGILALKGRHDLRFTLENVSLVEVQELAGIEPTAAGLLAGSGRIGGTSRSPVIQGELSLAEGRLGGLGIRRLHSRIDYAERELRLGVELAPGLARTTIEETTAAEGAGTPVDGGSLSLHGTLPVDLALGPVPRRFPDRPLDLRVESRDLDLALLRTTPAAAPEGAEGLETYEARQAAGTLELDMRLTGRPSAPLLAGRFSLEEAQIGNIAVERLGGSLDYSNREMRLEVELTEDAGSLSLRGTLPVDLALGPVARRFPDRPLDLRVESRGLDLAVLQPTRVTARETAEGPEIYEARQTSGALELDLRLAGRPSEPLLEGRFSLERAQLRNFAVERLSGSLGYSDRELRLDVELEPGIPQPEGGPAGVARGAGRLSLRGTFPVDLAVGPVAQRIPDREIDLRVESRELDLKLLQAFSPRVREASGPVDLGVHLTGRPSEPRYEGGVTVRDGAFRMGAEGPRYSAINGSVRFDNDRISLEGLRVASPGGEARLDGRIALRELALGDIDAELRARRFTLMDEDGKELIVDADLDLTGTTKTPSIIGTLNVEQMEWPLPEQRDKDVIDVDEAILYVRAEGDTALAEPPPDVWRETFLDVDVTVEDDAILKSNKALIVLEGEVSIDKPRGADRPLLAGSIDVVRGYYADFGKRFEVAEGEVFFYGTPELNPGLNVVATTTVENSATAEDVEVTLTLGGTVKQPTLDVSSNPALDKSEIFSLLLFGTTTPGQGEQRRFQETVTRVATRQAAGQLQRALASELGLDILEVQPGVGAEGTTFRAGKYIATDVFVTYSQGQPPEQESQFGLEYRLSRKWTLATQAGSRQFGADIFYEFQY